MKLSQFLAPTLKEDPADAEVVSHKLMVRAGMIRQVARGIYDFLPLGLRVVRRVEAIVREEMDRAGAQEILMPAVCPGRAVAGERALGAVRQGAAALQGPQRPRLLLRPDARGGDHRHRAARGPLVPRAAAEPLPDPDEVPRRGAAALRPHARARVHHEGRLLVPRRRTPTRSASTRSCTTPTRASSSAAASTFRPVEADTGAIGGSHVARVPGAGRVGRGRAS